MVICASSSDCETESESEVLLNLLTMERVTENTAENRVNLIGFRVLIWITEFLAIILFLLTLIWCIHFGGGFAWRSDPNLQFNWHPFLMISGMIILYSQSILVYRIYREKHKRQLKLIHASIHGVVFLLSMIAMIAVFDFHNLSKPPKPNLYSLHSWMGLTTNLLFLCQYISGFVTFMFPGLDSNVRIMYMPVHVFFGIAGFGFAVTTSLLGLSEKAIFKLKNYGDLPSEGLLINFIGVFLVLFAAFVFYTVTKFEYKRKPREEDGNLLTSRSE